MFYHIWTIFPSPGKRIWPKSYRKIQVPHLCQYRPCPALAPSVQTLITAGVFCISCLKLCLQFWRQFFIVFRWSSLQFKSIFCPLPVLVFRLYFAIVFTASPRFALFALILFTRIVKNSRLKVLTISTNHPGGNVMHKNKTIKNLTWWDNDLPQCISRGQFNKLLQV